MFDGHAHQWLDLAIRWTHVIVGIAWIGTSFYFNWLNNHIRKPESGDEGVAGELWSVHGGGFYRVLKYEVAPESLPAKLHWFKWEAYATWLSGFALLALVYWLGPIGTSVDPSRADLSRLALIGIGIGSMLVAWFVYDLLCKSPLGTRPGLLAAIGVVAVGALAYGFSQILTGRAAYIHVGAVLGTLMTANVFADIIPAQRRMVDAMTRGETPDPKPLKDAARRSLHNNYLTLPVVFIMVSIHFPMTFGSEWNWGLLAALSVIGALVRHWFNLRGQGHLNVWILPAAVAGMIALAVVTVPQQGGDPPTEVPDEIMSIIDARCASCHSRTTTQAGFTEAPKGIVFDTKEDALPFAITIGRVVDNGFMPLGNITAMTDEERQRVTDWAFGG
ncbi:MAG: urate hydroxylase PuuD [Acidimicrobiia bacterium]